MVGHKAVQRFAALLVLALVMVVPATAWAVAAVVNPLNSVSFSDPLHGYITGFTTSGSLPSVVSYTHDGGLTWHAHIVPNTLLDYVAASPDGVSASAVGDPTDAIQWTSDAGVTWHETKPVLNRLVDILGFAYLTGGRRVIVGDLHPSNYFGFIASSVGGGSWGLDFQGPFRPKTDPDIDPPTAYNKISAVDAAPGGDVAWAAGYDLTDNPGPTYPVLLYKTIDGGSSWTTQTISATVAEIRCISVPDTQTAFAGQANRILLRTRDGGLNWAALPSTLPGLNSVTWNVPVNAIDALDKDHILMVGDSGHIGWSINASADTPTFTVTTAQTANHLRGAAMLTSSHWIVVGDNETILQTYDAGATWTGSKGMTPPTLAITAPTRESMLSSTTISIEGTATDGAGIGVAKVEVRLQRGGTEGQPIAYWSGSAWQPSEVWMPASTTDGWNTWSLQAALGSISDVDSSMTITARAVDGLSTPSSKLAVLRSKPGSTCTIISANPLKLPLVWRGQFNIYGRLVNAETGSGLPSATVTLDGVTSTGAKTPTANDTTDGYGYFSFNVAPDRATTYTVRFAGDATVNASTSSTRKIFPVALIGTPGLPSYVTHTKYFKAYADLWPVHTPGTAAITLYFERYQLVGSVRKWVVLKTVSATAYTTTISGSTRSRCSVSVKLPAGRSWRVRARHWDPDHVKTYSPYKYFRVY